MVEFLTYRLKSVIEFPILLVGENYRGRYIMKSKLMITVVVVLLMGISGAIMAKGDPIVGKSKADICASCHGVNGEGVEQNPKIAGMAAGHFIKQMKAYKTGEHNHPMMEMSLQKLSEQDLEDMAAYYASLK